MNWLRNFMYGRNGVDQLSIAAVVLGLLTSLVVSFIPVPCLNLIPLVPYGYSFFRIFSRNVTKRRAENNRFISWWNPAWRRIARKAAQLKDKQHKYYSCPKCKATLRVPRGKGKIAITCPRCSNEITKRT
jgi:DNA-directed RNA polymerase subunit RPC12/RpoP